MKTFIEILKYIGLILMIFVLVILINSKEEKPHEVIIDGKNTLDPKNMLETVIIK
jgi:hypothetical protein